MRKNIKQPAEKKVENVESGSDNILENERYIKKLLVQRSVLTKLAGTAKIISPGDQGPD